MEFIPFKKEKFLDDWLSQEVLDLWKRAIILEYNFKRQGKHLPIESLVLVTKLARSARIYFDAFDNDHDVWCQDDRYGPVRGPVPRSNDTMQMWEEGYGEVSTVLIRFDRDLTFYWYFLCDEATRIDLQWVE